MVITTLSSVLCIEGDVAMLGPSRTSRRIANIGWVGFAAVGFLGGTWLLVAKPLRMAEELELFETVVGASAIVFGAALAGLGLLGIGKGGWTIDRAANSLAFNGRPKLALDDIKAIVTRRDDAGGEAMPQWSVGLRTANGKPLYVSYERDAADAERLSSALATFLGVPSEST
jgi:hypothetical protein